MYIDKAVIEPDALPQWRASGRCFLLAEATRNEIVCSLAEQQCSNNPERNRLYWGELGRLHASLSPYLLEVTKDNWAMLEEQVFNSPDGGILLLQRNTDESSRNVQNFDQLVHHLRTWIWIADNEDDDAQLMRIADAQVLECLLEAGSEQAVADFFAPFDALVLRLNGVLVEYRPQTSLPASPYDLQQPRRLEPEQYQALSAMAQLARHQAYTAHLHEHHPGTQAWGREQLLAFIDTHIADAHASGFKGQQQTIKYLTLAYLFGNDFKQQDWASAIINRSPQGADDRMTQLYRAAESELDKDVHTHEQDSQG